MTLKSYVMRLMSSRRRSNEDTAVKNFWYLFVAYSTIWTALCLYMVRLSRQNRELKEAVRTLQVQVERALTK